MKKFSNFKNDLPKTKVAFSFCRFQPPTPEHSLLLSSLRRIASIRNADHAVFTDTTQNKKNPLSADRKLYYLSRMYGGMKFQQTNTSNPLIEIAKRLNEKYKHIIIVASGVMASEFALVLQNANGNDFHFDTIEYVPIGYTDPDSVTSEGQIALSESGNFDEFKKYTNELLSDSDTRRLMNDIRIGVGLEPIKERINLVKDETRESYFRGDVLRVGELVECDNVKYEIIKRGTNHVLLKSDSGVVCSKWIKDVVPVSKNLEQTDTTSNTTEGVIQPNGTDKIEVTTMYNNKRKPCQSNVDVKNAESECDDIDDDSIYNKIGYSLGGPERSDTVRRMQIKHHLGEGELATADYKISASGRKYRAHRFKLGDSEKKEIEESSITQHDDDNLQEFSDQDLERIVSKVEDENDILHLYDDDEFKLIDQDTGEEVLDDVKESMLNEVLSRVERMRAKIRFARGRSKRERRLKIVLHSRSSVTKINNRARRLAIQLLKSRIARKPLNKLSTAEKERLERIIERSKNTVSRLAMKLVPKIRKIENDRLTHKKG